MKYQAIIMIPKIINFENSGNSKNVTNQGWALVSNYATVTTPDHTFGPNLLAILPHVEEPLVFDPPPMAA